MGFYKNLVAKGVGAKDWANSFTEVEYLGDDKFGASITTGNRVFKDKTDNKWKKHKLTDDRPTKDYVLVQSAKCCVEVYPYYAKYYDVNHEEVRLYEERWVVQRLFKEPDEWRDVDAYNPVVTVEEYPEPAGDVVKVTVTYDSDYGVLTVEYFQRDGNALKHNVTFKNTSGSEETFRVLQRWAGIVGTKCNGKDIPIVEDAPYFAFHSNDKTKKKFNIAENLYSMIFNPDGTEKNDQCLQRPVSIDTHAQGMKVDFIYAKWVLVHDESLEIDPDTATLDDPTEDGYISLSLGVYARYNIAEEIKMRWDGENKFNRGYVEWDVSSIPSGSEITDTVFRYHGKSKGRDCHIHEMVGTRPSTTADDQAGNASIYGEIGEGTIYVNPTGFPVVGTVQEVDLGTDADSDLEGLLGAGWFAIGIQLDSEGGASALTEIYSEDKTDAANPKPALYVEYEEAPTFVRPNMIKKAIIRR